MVTFNPNEPVPGKTEVPGACLVYPNEPVPGKTEVSGACSVLAFYLDSSPQLLLGV